MRRILFGFVFGVVVCHQLTTLPPLTVQVLAAAAGLVLVMPRWRLAAAGVIGGTLLGVAYAASVGTAALEHRLPPRLEGRDVAVSGTVVGLPRDDSYRDVFMLEVRRFPAVRDNRAPRRLRLSWYDPPERVRPGQEWTFTVRLKRPRGLMNPGAFDYERWLFAEGIDGVGYVRGDARLVADGGGIDRVRDSISQRVDASVGDVAGVELVKALAVADRRGIEPEQWTLFNETGTGHLLAISGLHIGLASVMGGWLFSLLWRSSARLCRRLPPRVVGLWCGLGVAAGYALLAGFGLPTQRALVMTGIATAAWFSRRDWRVGDVLLWALSAVLLLQPLAPLGAGLWLSFWAVAVILVLAMVSRRRVRAWVAVQVGVSLALLPLTALWFAQLALLSPVANAVAVPLVSLVIVPLVFAGLAAMVVLPALAAHLLFIAAWLLDQLLGVLGWLREHTVLWTLPELPLWLGVSACLAAILLCIPGRWPGKPLSLTLLVPLVLYRPPAIPAGAARVTFADVGQGTGVVVETRHRTLVFDAGPGMGRTDAAEAALLPLLRSRGRSRIDHLMISHADSDHAGGLKTLVNADLAIGRISAGEPLEGIEAAVEPCRSGQRWRWDGVTFSVLHPDSAMSGNDTSCVLKIASSDGTTALLAGDISAAIERRLLRDRTLRLDADLLLAPHHGSASSSSAAFVSAAEPAEVVFSTGYRNRYGLPDDAVVARYTQAGARTHRTWRTGAIAFTLDDSLRLEERLRFDRHAYFHAR